MTQPCQPWTRCKIGNVVHISLHLCRPSCLVNPCCNWAKQIGTIWMWAGSRSRYFTFSLLLMFLFVLFFLTNPTFHGLPGPLLQAWWSWVCLASTGARPWCSRSTVTGTLCWHRPCSTRPPFFTSSTPTCWRRFTGRWPSSWQNLVRIWFRPLYSSFQSSGIMSPPGGNGVGKVKAGIRRVNGIRGT